MAGITYDYNPFELPIEGMKVPEWVQTNELPFDAFAIADNVKKQRMAEEAQNLNSMIATQKLVEAIKQQQAEANMAQIAKNNPGLPLDSFSQQMMQGALSNGDVENALKWGNIVYNSKKNDDLMQEKIKSREAKNQFDNEKLDMQNRMIDARMRNMETLAALQAANSALSREKWDTQKSSAKNWEIFQDANGQDVSRDTNDPATAEALRRGELSVKPKKSGGIEDLLSLGSSEPLPVKIPTDERIRPKIKKQVNSKTGQIRYVNVNTGEVVKYGQ